jgi:hypothetical protein
MIPRSFKLQRQPEYIILYMRTVRESAQGSMVNMTIPTPRLAAVNDAEKLCRSDLEMKLENHSKLHLKGLSPKGSDSR